MQFAASLLRLRHDLPEFCSHSFPSSEDTKSSYESQQSETHDLTLTIGSSNGVLDQ